jgi:plastocyanin
VLVALIPLGAISAGASRGHRAIRQVTVPEEDRFAPFAITIRAGDAVRWVNNDSDNHTVVSDDAFNTAGHQGTDDLQTASGGTVVLRSSHAGAFVYYCRFHAHLDSENQPVAPGPDGGIQDANAIRDPDDGRGHRSAGERLDRTRVTRSRAPSRASRARVECRAGR